MQKCNMWKVKSNNKTLPTRLLQCKDSRKKHNIQGDIRTLLERDCEVEMMIRFLREIGMFEEIKR